MHGKRLSMLKVWGLWSFTVEGIWLLRRDLLLFTPRALRLSRPSLASVARKSQARAPSVVSSLSTLGNARGLVRAHLVTFSCSHLHTIPLPLWRRDEHLALVFPSLCCF